MFLSEEALRRVCGMLGPSGCPLLDPEACLQTRGHRIVNTKLHCCHQAPSVNCHVAEGHTVHDRCSALTASRAQLHPWPQRGASQACSTKSVQMPCGFMSLCTEVCVHTCINMGIPETIQVSVVQCSSAATAGCTAQAVSALQALAVLNAVVAQATHVRVRAGGWGGV